MRIGTKSLLFGAHAFWLHPFMVAIGWWALYGFPWDPRLWVAFIVHDWGYWGKSNMDGKEGENHPRLGAIILSTLFDRGTSNYWLIFGAHHSRSYARLLGKEPSKLCWADKMGVAITPRILYVPGVILSGEAEEYIDLWSRHHTRPSTTWEWFTLLKKSWRRRALAGAAEWLKYNVHYK